MKNNCILMELKNSHRLQVRLLFALLFVTITSALTTTAHAITDDFISTDEHTQRQSLRDNANHIANKLSLADKTDVKTLNYSSNYWLN